jgi:hypothetical protein
MKEINILSEEYLSNLKRKSFNELSQLEKYHEEKIIRGRNSGTIAIRRDTISDRELRIVIQIYCHWILGIGNMYADGFRINSKGKANKLTEEELCDFT